MDQKNTLPLNENCDNQIEIICDDDLSSGTLSANAEYIQVEHTQYYDDIPDIVTPYVQKKILLERLDNYFGGNSSNLTLEGFYDIFEEFCITFLSQKQNPQKCDSTAGLQGTCDSTVELQETSIKIQPDEEAKNTIDFAKKICDFFVDKICPVKNQKTYVACILWMKKICKSQKSDVKFDVYRDEVIDIFRKLFFKLYRGDYVKSRYTFQYMFFLYQDKYIHQGRNILYFYRNILVSTLSWLQKILVKTNGGYCPAQKEIEEKVKIITDALSNMLNYYNKNKYITNYKSEINIVDVFIDLFKSQTDSQDKNIKSLSCLYSTLNQFMIKMKGIDENFFVIKDIKLSCSEALRYFFDDTKNRFFTQINRDISQLEIIPVSYSNHNKIEPWNIKNIDLTSEISDIEYCIKENRNILYNYSCCISRLRSWLTTATSQEHVDNIDKFYETYKIHVFKFIPKILNLCNKLINVDGINPAICKGDAKEIMNNCLDIMIKMQENIKLSKEKKEPLKWAIQIQDAWCIDLNDDTKRIEDNYGNSEANYYYKCFVKKIMLWSGLAISPEHSNDIDKFYDKYKNYVFGIIEVTLSLFGVDYQSIQNINPSICEDSAKDMMEKCNAYITSIWNDLNNNKNSEHDNQNEVEIIYDFQILPKFQAFLTNSESQSDRVYNL